MLNDMQMFIMRLIKRLRSKSEAMSMVGCFGDCAFGEGDKPPPQRQGMNIVFHPPIMTMHKEKEPTKWYTDMINCLAGLGSDPNQLNEFGQAPLCMASYRAQGLIVEKLLQRENINVNIKGRHGRTPLYLAAEEGHVYIVQLLLLHQDIDVNCRNAPRGATPLMAASRRGHSKVVELLLQHPDIIPDLPDRDGNNALQHARTASVKCKLHSFARSKSLENVIPTGNRMNARNICHTSNSSSSSSSSLNSIGESSKRTPARKVSLDRNVMAAGQGQAAPQAAAAVVQDNIKEEERSPESPDLAALMSEGCQVQEKAALLSGGQQQGAQQVAAAAGEAAGKSDSRLQLQQEERSGAVSLSGGAASDGQVSSAPAVMSSSSKQLAAAEESPSVACKSSAGKDSPSSSRSSVLSSPGKKSRCEGQLSPASRSPFAAFAKAKNIFNFGE